MPLLEPHRDDYRELVKCTEEEFTASLEDLHEAGLLGDLHEAGLMQQLLEKSRSEAIITYPSLGILECPLDEGDFSMYEHLKKVIRPVGNGYEPHVIYLSWWATQGDPFIPELIAERGHTMLLHDGPDINIVQMLVARTQRFSQAFARHAGTITQ